MKRKKIRKDKGLIGYRKGELTMKNKYGSKTQEGNGCNKVVKTRSSFIYGYAKAGGMVRGTKCWESLTLGEFGMNRSIPTIQQAFVNYFQNLFSIDEGCHHNDISKVNDRVKWLVFYGKGCFSWDLQSSGYRLQ